MSPRFQARQKGKLLDRIDAAVRPVLEPGEEVVVAAHGFVPPRWAWMLIVNYGVLLLAANWYFTILTDRRLILMRVARTSTKRAELAETLPRDQVWVETHKPAWTWQRLDLKRADGGRLKLRFARIFKDDVSRMAELLGRAPADAPS